MAKKAKKPFPSKPVGKRPTAASKQSEPGLALSKRPTFGLPRRNRGPVDNNQISLPLRAYYKVEPQDYNNYTESAVIAGDENGSRTMWTVLWDIPQETDQNPEPKEVVDLYFVINNITRDGNIGRAENYREEIRFEARGFKDTIHLMRTPRRVEIWHLQRKSGKMIGEVRILCYIMSQERMIRKFMNTFREILQYTPREIIDYVNCPRIHDLQPPAYQTRYREQIRREEDEAATSDGADKTYNVLEIQLPGSVKPLQFFGFFAQPEVRIAFRKYWVPSANAEQDSEMNDEEPSGAIADDEQARGRSEKVRKTRKGKVIKPKRKSSDQQDAEVGESGDATGHTRDSSKKKRGGSSTRQGSRPVGEGTVEAERGAGTTKSRGKIAKAGRKGK